MPLSQHLRYSGPLPATVWEVLAEAYHKGGIAAQGNFARAYSLSLALAASLGWVSTINPNGQAYSHVWRVTVAGLTALEHKELFA